MNKDDTKKSFLELCKGAMLERFDYEMEKVIDNILDPNTPAKKPRSITLTLTLKSDEERRQLFHETIVKPKLQPTNPIAGSVAIVPDHNGELTVVEMVPQIPGQMNVNGNEQDEPTVIHLFRKQA